jgi:hypothetical protein
MRRICVESRVPHLRDGNRLGADGEREAFDCCRAGGRKTPLCPVKERAGHERHEIGYARNRQRGAETGDYSNHLAREVEGSQRFVYRTMGATSA